MRITTRYQYRDCRLADPHVTFFFHFAFFFLQALGVFIEADMKAVEKIAAAVS